MKSLVQIVIFFILIGGVTLSQTNSDPVVGGLYFQGRGIVGMIVGGKDIARITVTLTAKDEFGDEVNYSRSQTFIGPFFAYGKYESNLPTYFLGRFPIGFISKVTVVYMDKSTKTFGKKRCEQMVGEYFDRIGRGG